MREAGHRESRSRPVSTKRANAIKRAGTTRLAGADGLEHEQRLLDQLAADGRTGPRGTWWPASRESSEMSDVEFHEQGSLPVCLVRCG